MLAKERFENITIQDIDGNIIDFSYTPNKKIIFLVSPIDCDPASKRLLR